MEEVEAAEEVKEGHRKKFELASEIGAPMSTVAEVVGLCAGGRVLN